jgi:rRNA maturation endonuclease Nob1
VDTSVLSRFGSIRRADLLESWQPLISPVGVLAEIDRSARGAIVSSVRKLRDARVLTAAPPASQAALEKVRAKDPRALLSDVDTEVLALGLEHGLPVLSDDQRLVDTGSELGISCYDMVDILGALKQAKVLDPSGMRGIIEALERQPSPRRFRPHDREGLLR